jgi:hypothetical protein
MIEPKPWDEAELKSDMRKMYKDIGYAGSLQCLYEILMSAKYLSEVMTEELQREREKN